MLKNSYINWQTLVLVLLINCLLAQVAIGQVKSEPVLLNPDNHFNKSRFNTVVLSEIGIATVATIGLQYLWYKKFPHSPFHFFNDNNEWLGMDKIGHATTAYNIAAVQYNLMRWSGVDNKKSILIGGFTGLGYLTMIEIMDGFSTKWGFSKGDMAANMLGSGLFVAQQYIWNQQRVQMRFSYHSSIFAKYNPGMLGENFPQRLLKDYNAQTYFLSFNIASFINRDNGFPRWLNADIGMGAEGMIGATENPLQIKGKTIPAFVRQRKLYAGFSPAFSKHDNFPYPSWLNIVHIPSPMVEWKVKTNEWKPFLLHY